jgi:hypothetical protein
MERKKTKRSKTYHARTVREVSRLDHTLVDAKALRMAGAVQRNKMARSGSRAISQAIRFWTGSLTLSHVGRDFLR